MAVAVTACPAATRWLVRHKDQMPVISSYLIVLSAEEEPVLIARARSVRSEYRDRLRARIVLAAAAGMANAAIAMHLDVHVDTVRKWRRRFAAARLAGLKDAPRSGRPPVFTAADRAEAVALACALPAESGLPLSKWSCPELARELAARCQITVSASTIGRWLASDALKPWQHRSWISVRDPGFAAKATVILDLYQGSYQGQPLRPGDRVVSVDAKPSIQARARCHATGPPGPGRPVHVEHEYQRAGALALLAALDVRTGKVFASCPQTTGIAPFMTLMGQVMSQEPYASAPRVFIIVDNGSDHRGQAAIRRLRDAWPNAIMIHTPFHASWLNQVEIFFSIVQKKVLTPNHFASLGNLTASLLAFTSRYNQTARPFNWKYTAADLAALLHRISTREHPIHEPAQQPEAA
jgi:transposase